MKNNQEKKAYLKEYYLKNKEKLKERARNQYNADKTPYLDRAKAQRALPEYKEYQSAYRKKNKKKLNKASAERFRRDPKLRMLNNIRGRVRDCIHWKKKDRTLAYIGCTVAQFMAHIESKFTPDMTWENMGPHWHLDHIIPANAFMFDDEKDIYKCFHYKNYQPLLSTHNLSKQDFIESIGMPAKTLKKDLTSYKKWRESLDEI